mgnify:FL=1
MRNLEVARILENIGDILELQEVPFKPQAYHKAALAVEFLTEEIKDIYNRGELEEIPGVGKHIAAKIEEILKTGKLKYYEQLKKKVKIDIEYLKEIPSLGPKKMKILYKKLGIKNIKDLEKEIKKKRIRELAGFGEKTELLIQEGINYLKSQPKRFLYLSTVPIVKEIKQLLNTDFVQRVEEAGSFRRKKETIGDLDFVVVSKKPEKVMKLLTSMPDDEWFAG